MSVDQAPALSSLIELDEDQRRVVEHERGPLLALGGPGTGKTTVLTERFVRLATAPTSSPDRILWLVANRAQKIALQNLLTQRLLFDEGLDALIEVPVYTWHGLAYHLVSRHYKQLGYSGPPVLLTSPEQWSDIKETLTHQSPVDWPVYKHLLDSDGFVDEVVDFCIRAAQRELELRELRELAGSRPGYAELVRFYEQHRSRLRNRAQVDYPTMMSDAAWLLANYEDVRGAVQQRFRHILVDEAQELSVVQQHLLSFLHESADEDRSLVVAGDPDSSIETFRGADPDWLNAFEGVFGSHESITLQRSYRMGAELGESVGAFMQCSDERPHRIRSWAGATRLEVRRFVNLSAELESVARALRFAHLKDGVAYEDMAVLLATPSAMLPALERAFNSIELPFSVSLADRSLEREPAVRTFCNLARFSFDEEIDSDEFVELLRSPLVGLEDRALRELERQARIGDVSLAELCSKPPGDLDETIRAPLAELNGLKKRLEAKKLERADEAFWVVWNNARYYNELRDRAREEDAAAIREVDALVSFSRALGRFVERRRGQGPLKDYLEAIGRADFGADPWLPPERRRGGVEVLSFHASKGRQWRIVCVCGCVEGAIPKGRRARGLFDPYFLDESSAVARVQKNDAEDRRVFHVAVTRASELSMITTSPGVTRRGQPSRYIEELTGREPEMAGLAELPPLTFAEAAGRHRRVLGDASAEGTDRVAALMALARVCELDPSCDAAQPREWWWRWDWTEGGVPIRAQSRSDGDDLPQDKLRTSYSRISQYDNCGLQYLFSVVLGLDPDTSHNMAFGTWIHQIFEDCEKEPSEEQRVAGRRRLASQQDLYDRFEELFDPSVFPNQAIARQFHRDGQVILQRYGKHLAPGSAALAEVSFTVDFEGHRIRGRIDRVDRKPNGVMVTDYKTSRYPVGWDEARASLQLAIYNLAARADEDIAALGEPISQQLVYPAVLRKGDVDKRTQTPEEAEEALERLPGLIAGVLGEDFRPDPEADCQWCRFKPLCPLWPEGKEVPA